MTDGEKIITGFGGVRGFKIIKCKVVIMYNRRTGHQKKKKKKGFEGNRRRKQMFSRWLK